VTDHLLDRLVAAVGAQYLVDAEIGRGGMAVVYRATDVRLNRRVAIKLLPPELAFNADVRERFLREAQTSAQLAHPNIVPIYTVDEREGLVYFVMALVDGESLAERLARERSLPIADARRILLDVADALGYAHQRGVVHRDVKPDNIMIDRVTGRAVVTDFGIARAAAGDSRLTVTGVAVGTPAYMSPEQAMGERELDGRSDIYSLAVVGYQMLAGETPFRASNTPAMLMKHLSETPRALQPLRPDAPPSLVHAISRALAKKPEQRWPDAEAFRAAFLDERFVPPHEERSNAARESAAPAARSPQQLAPQQLAPQRLAMPASVDNPLGQPPEMPPLPPLPTFGSREEWRRWRVMQRNWEQERRRREKLALHAWKDDARKVKRSATERITRWRHRAIGSVSTMGMLGAINAFTSPGHWWFLFPSAFIAFSVVQGAGKLWADGIPLGRLLSGDTRGLDAGQDAPALPAGSAVEQLAQRLAPADVLAGRYGQSVRRAADDRLNVEDTIGRLSPAEREMIPDVAPTVVALSERVGSLAATLHGLEADVSSASVTTLEQRAATLRAEAGDSPTPEQERRIALLERQRATIAELITRREVLSSQLESAMLALQNLRLDLLKLRSSGLASVMTDLSSATQEARAISRDIGHAVDAVGEVRRL